MLFYLKIILIILSDIIKSVINSSYREKYYLGWESNPDFLGCSHEMQEIQVRLTIKLIFFEILIDRYYID